MKKSEAPPVEAEFWPREAIDHFVLARLEQEELHPAAEADRTTWLRRVSFDLVGLPPTPNAVSAFLKDDRADAYERVVDGLLRSPRYGERWAQHWLDVVRYADTHGFEVNTERPTAWPYRDYVIDSLNFDKSYDQFIREQIAGDLLPEIPYESAEEREDRLIATSMLSFGTKRHNSGGTAYRMEIVDDQIDVAYRLSRSEWRGQQNLQLTGLDIKK